MKYTEVIYQYNGKAYTAVVAASEFRTGDVTYYQGIVNRLESLTDAGAVIIRIDQYN